jgi:two-component system response regulator FixJ
MTLMTSKSHRSHRIDHRYEVRIIILDAIIENGFDLVSQFSGSPLVVEAIGNLSELDFHEKSVNLIMVRDEHNQLAEALRWRLEAGISAPIVAYTENPKIDQVVEAMKAGAHDYLRAPFDNATIARIVRLAHSETSRLPAEHSRHQTASSSIDRLSSRERQILIAMSEGLTSRQIAEDFSISRRTVETHRYNLLRKLGSIRTAQAIRLVAEGALAGNRPLAGIASGWRSTNQTR